MASQSQSSGIGLGVILFVVFLVLKLTGVIDWSWWWVTAPLWAGLAVGIVIIGVLVLGAGAFAVIQKAKRH